MNAKWSALADSGGKRLVVQEFMYNLQPENYGFPEIKIRENKENSSKSKQILETFESRRRYDQKEGMKVTVFRAIKRLRNF